MFFILSGYVITLSIFANTDRNGRFSIVQYSISRLLRIYPPLLCAIAVTFVVYAVVARASLPGAELPLKLDTDLYNARDLLTVNPMEWWSALTMRAGLLLLNGPLWSLYIELKLYVAAGALAYMAAGLSKRHFQIVVGGAVFYFIMGKGIAENPEFLHYSAWWFIGALFFLKERMQLATSVFVLLLTPLLVSILYLSSSAMVVEASRVVMLVGLSYIFFEKWRSGTAVLMGVAGYSYTLYLLHFPILLLVYSAFLALNPAGDVSQLSRVGASVIGVALVFLVSRAVAGFAEDSGAIRRALGQLTKVSGELVK